MKNKFVVILCLIVFSLGIAGCGSADRPPKIGVSMGVGNAERWAKEKTYMEERAKELNVDIQVLLNKTDKPKTQAQDCMDLIDSGVNVLIITPRDATKLDDVLEYAYKKGVKVLAYSRPIDGKNISLFIGYDNYKIGQYLGQHLIEKVYKGNFIILQGDKDDYNARLLNEGSMEYINSLGGDNINIILNANVPGWSRDAAKKMVIDALLKNNKEVHAILAPNDKIADACNEALKELNITNHVIMTGMDAELPALRRLVVDEQDITMYMNLRELSNIAIDEACNIITKKKATSNTEFKTEKGNILPAYLISGQIITKTNLDKALIETGVYTNEQVYGK